MLFECVFFLYLIVVVIRSDMEKDFVLYLISKIVNILLNPVQCMSLLSNNMIIPNSLFTFQGNWAIVFFGLEHKAELIWMAIGTRIWPYKTVKWCTKKFEFVSASWCYHWNSQRPCCRRLCQEVREQHETLWSYLSFCCTEVTAS